METKNVLNNTKWIIGCKIVQSLLQLVIGMLCARYLGPSNYGLISYATSIAAFALPIMKLGFDSTLVRELVEHPEEEGAIMGTALTMNLISAMLCIGGFVSVVNHGEPVTIVVCVLYSITLLCSALEMMQYWFQYKLLSRYSSVVMLAAYVLVSAYRIFLLITGKSVYWFAITNALDYGLIGISLIVLFGRNGGRLCVSVPVGKRMFRGSRQYILASLMVVVFHSTDHVMLTAMVGTTENGYYSAAVTCATVVQFVYMAIVDSYRPLILSRKKENHPEYETDISRLYTIMVYVSFLQSLIFTIFARWIVTLLYARAYLPAVPVLQILVWYNAFSFMGVVRNVWILAEQKQKYLWRINLTGAAANVALNAWLIPVAGACGAAAASLLTQFFTNFVLGFVFAPLRPNNRLMLRGLAPSFAVRQLRDWKHVIKLLRK